MYDLKGTYDTFSMPSVTQARSKLQIALFSVAATFLKAVQTAYSSYKLPMNLFTVWQVREYNDQ